MSFLKKLFGSDGAGNAPDPILHKDFLIFPEPMKEAGGYRIAARIEKVIDGETKVHQMIRADSYSSIDIAGEAAVAKAKLFIDQMGEGIFD
ncbi:MAG: HlyU family transcriptional regulator [Pseudomonadota bacterium]